MKYYKYIHINTIIVLLYQEIYILYLGLSMTNYLMFKILIITGGIILGYSAVKAFNNFNEAYVVRYLIFQASALIIGLIALVFLVTAWGVRDVFPDWLLNTVILLAGSFFVSILMLLISLFFRRKAIQNKSTLS